MSETAVTRLPEDLEESLSSVLQTYGIRYGGGSIIDGIVHITVNPPRWESQSDLERISTILMRMFCINSLVLNGTRFGAVAV